MDNPPARGQLERKISFSLSPFAPGNLPLCHASNTTATVNVIIDIISRFQPRYEWRTPINPMQNGNKKLKKNVRLRVCEHYISVLEQTVLYSISVSEERRCSESDAQHSYRYKKLRLNARHILFCTSISTKHVLRATYLAKTCIISVISENDNKAPQLLCACSINGLMNKYNCCRFSLCTKSTPYSFP